ncbi:hypothetical protein B0H63DRAFT_525998 [Podospora didyma]|uniref:Uncharacterized protein n=1 Tax=Podospora didyma TaxID=330526 RepID=A0AAE0KDG2_9PEZI|nr:hypothetical protein B0H63DRAFT_525998 [Podospora didyma]
MASGGEPKPHTSFLKAYTIVKQTVWAIYAESWVLECIVKEPRNTFDATILFTHGWYAMSFLKAGSGTLDLLRQGPAFNAGVDVNEIHVCAQRLLQMLYGDEFCLMIGRGAGRPFAEKRHLHTFADGTHSGLQAVGCTVCRKEDQQLAAGGIPDGDLRVKIMMRVAGESARALEYFRNEISTGKFPGQFFPDRALSSLLFLEAVMQSAISQSKRDVEWTPVAGVSRFTCPEAVNLA